MFKQLICGRLGSGDAALLSEPILVDLAKKHGCDAGAVMLAWGVQAGHSVVPKVCEFDN